MASNPEDLLTGAYIEIAVVTDLGQTTESETIIGETMGETTISGDYNEAEFNLHEDEWRATKTLNGQITLEFVCALTTDMPQLETLSLVDSNGDPTTRAVHDIRLYVYNEPPADASSSGVVLEFYAGDTRFNEAALPQDGSEVSFSVRANGGYQLGKTTA